MADIRTNAVNAWESTLSSALATGATTINVTDTTGSPAVPFYVVLDPGNDSKREVVLVDGAKTATTFTLSAATSRGQDGTSDVAHDSGAVVAIVPVAAMFNDLHDRVDAGDTALATHEGAADPHPDYLTAAEGDALFLTPAEGNAAYEAKVSRTGAAAGEVPVLQGDGTLAFKDATSVVARTIYNPGTFVSLSTTSTTYVDVDAANLSVTFTVPTSGEVLIRLVALAWADASHGYWNLREGTADISGSQGRYTNTDATPRRYSHDVVLTGLTPGASKTYKWGHRTDTGGTANMQVGSAVGLGIMEVWAL